MNNLDCLVLDALEDSEDWGRTAGELSAILGAPRRAVLSALAMLAEEGYAHARWGLWLYGGAP